MHKKNKTPTDTQTAGLGNVFDFCSEWKNYLAIWKAQAGRFDLFIGVGVGIGIGIDKTGITHFDPDPDPDGRLSE